MSFLKAPKKASVLSTDIVHGQYTCRKQADIIQIQMNFKEKMFLDYSKSKGCATEFIFMLHCQFSSLDDLRLKL